MNIYMRKWVIILFSLLVLFGLNLIMYWFNEDYRFFVKKLKYSGEWTQITDQQLEVNYYNDLPEEIAIVDPEPEEVKIDIPEKKELELWEAEKRILSKFFSYDLERILVKQSLFDLTSEYPDDYFEYLGLDGDMILYLFWSREYESIREIFEVISYDMPYTLNEVNNFWEASFFINVDEEFNDDFIRFIIKSTNGVFWLKIKKDLYNDTKEILKNI